MTACRYLQRGRPHCEGFVDDFSSNLLAGSLKSIRERALQSKVSIKREKPAGGQGIVGVKCGQMEEVVRLVLVKVLV